MRKSADHAKLNDGSTSGAATTHSFADPRMARDCNSTSRAHLASERRSLGEKATFRAKSWAGALTVSPADVCGESGPVARLRLELVVL